jgi:uncharacterized protein
MQRVAVALSGGVDSAVLLALCVDVLGRHNVVAVTGVSELQKESEVVCAAEIARDAGVDHVRVAFHPLARDEVSGNTPRRCYACKRALFSAIGDVAEARGIDHVLEGSSADDAHDFRPGMRALAKLGVRQPLLDAGVTKREIREYARNVGLECAERPAEACLATRIPCGSPLFGEVLQTVRDAERAVGECGFSLVRVRHHGDLARIEVDDTDLAVIVDPAVRTRIVRRLRTLGYAHVCVDLCGYRRGSMNAEGGKDGK